MTAADAVSPGPRQLQCAKSARGRAPPRCIESEERLSAHDQCIHRVIQQPPGGCGSTDPQCLSVGHRSRHVGGEPAHRLARPVSGQALGRALMPGQCYSPTSTDTRLDYYAKPVRRIKGLRRLIDHQQSRHRAIVFDEEPMKRLGASQGDRRSSSRRCRCAGAATGRFGRSGAADCLSEAPSAQDFAYAASSNPM